MAKNTDQKTNLILKPEKLEDFISKISDLTKIEDVIKLKIDSENIHLYSMLGETTMLAFKNFILKTNDYFEIKNLDFTLNIIIISAKKFVKNLQFLSTTDKINLEITSRKLDDNDQEADTRLAIIKNGKFKLTIPSGENTEIKDLSIEKIKKFQNPKNCRWSFNLSKKDFQDIKKLSSINSEENKKVLSIDVNDGIVKLSEQSTWELEVDKIETENDKNLIFNKSFLGSIMEDENVTFKMYDNFILFNKDENSLMISFEQTID